MKNTCCKRNHRVFLMKGELTTKQHVNLIRVQLVNNSATRPQRRSFFAPRW